MKRLAGLQNVLQLVEALDSAVGNDKLDLRLFDSLAEAPDKLQEILVAARNRFFDRFRVVDLDNRETV